MPQVNGHASDGRQQNKTCKIDQSKAGNLPELITTGSNQEVHFRQNSFDSNYSEEEGYDSLVVNVWLQQDHKFPVTQNNAATKGFNK